MNIIAVMIGVPSLLFGLLIAYGLFRRFNGRLIESPPKKRWILGVCEDFSRMVGMQLWLMRMFFLNSVLLQSDHWACLLTLLGPDFSQRFTLPINFYH